MGDGKPVLLATKATWDLGRDPGSDLVLDDDLVSRRHAMIVQTDAGEYLLVDVGSRNGVYLNERRLAAPTPLQNGDRVRLGGHAYLFLVGPEDAIGRSPEASEALAADDGTLFDATSQDATILVVDIKDFTGLSQRTDPAVLGRFLATWSREAGRILHAFGCDSDKYQADGVLAMWWHVDQRGPRESIVAALGSLVPLAETVDRMRGDFGLDATIRIAAGLNTGLVVLGNMGSVRTADHTAVGESVNRAFRLEAAAKELGVDVLLDDEVVRLVAAAGVDLSGLPQHQVRLKGYAEPIASRSVGFDALPELVRTLAEA